jgi:hypothetical protein
LIKIRRAHSKAGKIQEKNLSSVFLQNDKSTYY